MLPSDRLPSPFRCVFVVAKKDPGDIGIASYINRDDVGCNAGIGCELMSYRVYNLDWSEDIAPLNFDNKTGYGFKVVRAAHATLSKLL